MISLEYPERWGGLVDLDPAGDAPDLARALAAALLEGGAEDQLAWRGARRLGARLQPLAEPLAAGPLQLAPEGSYLVTGGLGFLGGQVASWLADLGARRLILTGRRGLTGEPSSGPEPQPDRGPILARLAELESRGVEVEVRCLDAADELALGALFDECQQLGRPIRGVAHLAGTSRPAPIAEIEEGDLLPTLSPKAGGAWAIHRVTADRALDFLLLFSSAAGIWGAARSGAYAAANHFLDALAAYRRARGLPASAVAWGRWPGGGMVGADVERYFDSLGLRVLPGEQALMAAQALVTSPRAQLVVASVDWQRFRPVYESRRVRPLLANVGGPAPDRGAGETRLTARVQRLAALPPSARRVQLTGHLRELVADVLGAAPDRITAAQGFFALGMNSLMAVELGRRIAGEYGIKLPSTVAFEHPTIGDLVELLLERLFSEERRETPPAAPPARPALDRPAPQPEALLAPQLEALSEEELVHLLAQTITESETQ